MREKDILPMIRIITKAITIIIIVMIIALTTTFHNNPEAFIEFCKNIYIKVSLG